MMSIKYLYFFQHEYLRMGYSEGNQITESIIKKPVIFQVCHYNNTFILIIFNTFPNVHFLILIYLAFLDALPSALFMVPTINRFKYHIFFVF